MQEAFTQEAARLLAEGSFLQCLANYDGPTGRARFCEALANLLRREYGWDIGAENIALTNGSQTAFFYLFNLLAGEFAQAQNKKVLFPLAPEYIGYADSALCEEMFVACKPRIEQLDNRLFKYHVDFNQLEVNDDIGLICVSRPTNPTGNVLTDHEIAQLDEIARAKGIPLLIDNAYGTPFPNIIFSEATPFWNENTILCMSLSKLGLPGARCGIVIARPEIIFFDEPTTGLHFADIQQLLDVLHQLRDQGNTIVVIEHNLDVIKTADWIVDLGPEGGSGGGEILVSGTPETVAECEASHTARFLKPLL